MKKDAPAEPLGRSVDSGRRKPIGVATVLPKPAADILVEAAHFARQFEAGTFARRRAIEDAIMAVKARWPECFRKD